MYAIYNDLNFFFQLSIAKYQNGLNGLAVLSTVAKEQNLGTNFIKLFFLVIQNLGPVL
jgi:hypothetical protein